MWLVYIVRCADGTLYTGATNNLEERVRQHNLGCGAKYTRSRRPVKLVWSLSVGTMGNALSMEHRIKRLSKAAKERLVS